MKGNSFFVTVLIALVGIVAGFLLANGLNRSELSALRADNDRLKAEVAQGASRDSKGSLTEEEIAATIAQAERSPNDFQTQRNVGIAVYRYAAMKQDPELIKRSITVLDRAAALRPDDYDILLSLGNANFDVGYFQKDNDALMRAREFYNKALGVKPDDPNIRTDLGLTYFLQTPQDLDGSIGEFRKALANDPKHEKTLQFMIQALAKQNKIPEAQEYLERLRQVNPRNESIAELESMLTGQQPAE